MRRLEDKLKQFEPASVTSQDNRSKVELKILIDFVTYVLQRVSIVTRIYHHYDFTCVRRPLITNIINNTMKVCGV